MKTNLILLASITITAGFIAQAEAQYPANDNDGITASPKVRQMLAERKGATVNTSPAKAAVTTRASSAPAIAASPKVSQLLAEQKANQAGLKTTVSSVQSQPAQTRLAASPHVQKEISERTSPPVQIAPLK